MSLINCPECNKSISESALSCPRCGFRLNFKIKENKRIIYNDFGVNKKREYLTQLPASKSFLSNYIKSVNLRIYLSSLFIGITIAIIMWTCSNYIIFVPNIVFRILSELQIPGKIISYLVIASLYNNDFQEILDAMEWVKYVEVLVNGIIYGFLIILIRYVVEKIRNRYQRNISRKSNVAG